MKIICPSCHHSAEAPDSVKGARVRCPLCATEFTAQETHAFTVLTPETPPEAKPHYTQRMAPYGTALKKCFTGFSFSGRASRSDYWFAMTLLVPITSLTGILGGISIVLQSAIGIIFLLVLAFLLAT